jgi:hypothetical protein
MPEVIKLSYFGYNGGGEHCYYTSDLTGGDFEVYRKDEADAEIAKLNKRNAAMMEDGCDDLRRIDKLCTERDELRYKLEQCLEKRVDCKETEIKLDEAEATIAELRRKLAYTEIEISDLRRLVSDMARQRNEAQAKLADSEKEREVNAKDYDLAISEVIKEREELIAEAEAGRCGDCDSPIPCGRECVSGLEFEIGEKLMFSDFSDFRNAYFGELWAVRPGVACGFVAWPEEHEQPVLYHFARRPQAKEPGLKPCPFCGGEPEKTGYYPATGIPEHFKVWCPSCRASTGGYINESESVDDWNRRA